MDFYFETFKNEFGKITFYNKNEGKKKMSCSILSKKKRMTQR